MFIDHVEKLKEWLTTSLTPICEADPGALAKYVVALVKKEKPIAELRESCVDQLDVFLQTKTMPFVDALFDVLEKKSYFTEEDLKPPPTQVEPDSQTILPNEPVTTTDPVPILSDTQLKIDKKPSTEDIPITENNKDVPVVTSNEPRRRRSRSRSPRFYRARDIEDRRRRYDERDRRPFDRGPQRRKSNSPIPIKQRLGPRPRSRSPNRRRSPYRPPPRSRSPRARGRGRPLSRSRSRSRSPRRSWSRSRSRDRFRSRSRSPYRARSKSPRRLVIRPRSPRPGSPRPRSRSPQARSKSPLNRPRSPGRRSPIRRISRSPMRRLSRSPVRRGSRSPVRRSSKSPLRRSRSPIKRSRSPGRRLSRSPLGRSASPDSRSRSPARFSRSRSLSTSRSGSPLRKVRRHSSDSRGPTPTMENGLVDSTNPTPTDSLSSISVVSSNRMRCRDFDEKGFCVRGDLCLYDHGADPVIVENVAPPYPPQGAPAPGLPPVSGPPPGHPGFNIRLPPPGFMNRMPGPPPPHILRPPGPEFQEYNPEAPGINLPPPPGFWPGGPRGPPPPRFLSGPPPRAPVVEPPRTRDLVNLTTVKREPEVLDEPDDDDDEVPTSSSRTVIAPKEEVPAPVPVPQPPPPGTLPDNTAMKPAPSYIQTEPQFIQQQRYHPYQRFPGPRKPFDYNRVGGYRRPDMTNCTLEVRKIPQDMNNIAKLNEHFGTFGTLKNIEVSYDGDPEAALITYRTNFEANKCYKSSEPVFNNRFIKLFWHRKPDAASTQEQAPSSTTTPGVPSTAQPDPDSSRQPAQARLGPIPLPGPPTIPPASKMSLNNTKKPTPSTQPTTSAEKNVVYTTSMGNINKTVYNPTAQKPKTPPVNVLVSPTAVHAADFISRIEAAKKHEAVKQEAVQKSIEIRKHKQQLLEKQIEQQKLLIVRLDKNKATMKEEEKTLIMNTLKTLTESIEKLKAELGGRKVVLKKHSSVEVKSPEQAKKEILDVELELMTKTTSGEDTADLKRKLNELTKVANSMGLLGRGRGRGGVVGRGRGSTTWVASGIAAPVPMVGRGRGRGALTGKAAIASRTLDRRPKVLEVTGFTAEEKEEMTTHLANLREVEKAEFNMAVPSVIIAFKTRHDAEMGMLYGSKFKTKMLKMVWHIAKPVFTRSSSNVSGDNEDADTESNLDEIDEEALLAGEDDDDESESERSWKH